VKALDSLQPPTAWIEQGSSLNAKPQALAQNRFFTSHGSENSENMVGLVGIEPTTSLRAIVFYDCDTVISIIWRPITFNYVPKTFTAEVQMVRQNCEDLDRHRRSPLTAGYNDLGVREWLKKARVQGCEDT
jgi:hypothetical protein